MLCIIIDILIPRLVGKVTVSTNKEIVYEPLIYEVDQERRGGTTSLGPF